MKKIFFTLLITISFVTACFAQGHTLSVGDVFSSYVSTAPANCLALDGSFYDSVTDASLYSILGTGKLPDWRGRSPIGAGQGTGLSNTYTVLVPFGEEKHQLTQNEMPSHSHDVMCYSHNANQKPPSNNSFASVQGTATNIYTNQAPDTTMATGTIANSGSNFSHNTVHPVQPVYWYIVAQ